MRASPTRPSSSSPLPGPAASAGGLVVGFAGLLVASCGGAGGPSSFPPPPEEKTTVELRSHRCQGSFCTCRREVDNYDQKEQLEPQGKRFEVRIGSSTGKAWVEIDGKERIYKSNERAEECFYIDLPPGEHTFALRARGYPPEGGVGVEFRVQEYAPTNAVWFDSFVFKCGYPGPCDKDTLDDFKGTAQTDRRSYRDPCGATWVKGLAWETGRMPDALHPEEFGLRFTLGVAARESAEKPRDPSCPLK